MRLKSIVLENIAVGDVLVGQNLWTEKSPQLRLIIVQGVEAEHLVLTPFAATFGDDDDLDEGEVRICKVQAKARLAIPTLEIGDRLLHRERTAIVQETKERDWHVKIHYTDAGGGEFYGNLIWMDLSPTLEQIQLEGQWPN